MRVSNLFGRLGEGSSILFVILGEGISILFGRLGERVSIFFGRLGEGVSILFGRWTSSLFGGCCTQWEGVLLSSSGYGINGGTWG